VEFDGAENKWPSHSLLKSLLEVLRLVKVKFGLGRGTFWLIVVLFVVISGILLSALARLLFGSCCECRLPSFLLVVNDFLSRFLN
jgi:hypothetical protein